jgi:membrane fusion protein, multidrug efflux system
MPNAQDAGDYLQERRTLKHGESARKRALLAGAVAVLAVVVAYLGWRWWAVARYSVTTDDAYTAADSIVVSPRVHGYVKQVVVSENQHVRRGDVLVTIDDTDYQLRIGQAQAQVRAKEAAVATLSQQFILQHSIIAQARAAVVSAQAQHARATDVYRRDRRLIEEGVISREKLETDHAAWLTASAEVDKAQAYAREVESESAVLLAKKSEQEADMAATAAALKSTQFDNDHTRIIAPIDGIVGSRNVQTGEYVNPGKQLFVLVPVADQYIIANFKETQISRIRVGQPVSFKLDAYPDLAGRGMVQSFAPATGSEFALLPPQNATGNFTKIVQRVPVKIRLLDGGSLIDKIRSGLSVVVTVDTRPDDIVISASAANSKVAAAKTPP